MTDESGLIRAAREGDAEAFGQLVTAKRELVLRAAYQVVGDLDRAQDVAQRVFLKVWKSLGLYDDSKRFDTWLYRITVNMAIDGLRRRASRPVMQPLESLGAVEPQARQDDSHAERGLDLARLRQAFVDLADCLSPQQRAVFTLRELEGLPGPEVARILDLGDSTVRNHLMQARKALRRGLREKYPELIREFGVAHVPGGKYDD